jgi:hypothetical protein
MAIYRALLLQIYPKKRVKTGLLWVQAPILMPLCDQLLENYVSCSYIVPED